MVTIDTWRADRLNARVMPNLARLVGRATVFDAARTTVPLTLPSHTTILTGLLPQAHGVHENGLDRLSAEHATIATLLNGAGYRTGAFVGAFVLDRRFGLARGFDVYDDRIARDPNAPDRLEAERPANVVVDAALAWLARPEAGAERTSHDAPRTPHPFFAWIHLYDPHAPYAPPGDYAARAGSAYDGEVMFADAQLARILEWTERSAPDTVVIVAGDHGEGLDEHGERTHGMLLYDSTLRVPLVAAVPGRPAAHRSDPVTLADIAPTLLRLANVAAPAEIQGRDLFDPQATRTLYSETDYPHVAGWSSLEALTDGRWMTIRSDTSIEMYDLEHDAAEQHDVAAAQPATSRAMTSRLDALRTRGPSTGRREVSAETAERLRSLGYVTGASQIAATGHAPNPAQHVATWNAFEDALERLNAGDRSAVASLRQLSLANPESMLFTTTLARALKDGGDLTAALAAYREAAHRWPTEPTVLHDLAVTAGDAAARAPSAQAETMRDEARRAEEAALAIQPDYAAAHNGLGLLAAAAGRDADALRDFGRATDLDPTNASYWTNLGNARRATNDAAGAEAAYTRALQLDDRDSDAANGLGALLVAGGRPADAAIWFERALAADPASVDARLNLGIALQQSGNATRAAAEYRAVLQAPPRYASQREAARKLLASLGAAR